MPLPVPSTRRRPRRATVALIALVVLAALAAAGTHLAARLLQSKLMAALGPTAQVGAVELGLSTVTVRDLRVAASADGHWPAPDELRAGTLVIRPGLRGLWNAIVPGPWLVDNVRVEDGYLSGLRSRDGKLHLLPSLTNRAAEGNTATASAASAPASIVSLDAKPLLVLHRVELVRCALELYDASLKTPTPHRVRFEDLDATVGPLALPGLARPVDVALQAQLKGVDHDGHVSLQGTLTPATKDAALKLQVEGADLVALQPYLFSLNQGGVKHGTLDLGLDVHVEHQHLHAPGSVTIKGLELAAKDGASATVATATRQALLDVLARRGTISAKFTLDGRLDDPSFSLNENLATRLAAGLGDAMGVGFQGVVEGMGRVLKGLVGR